jgi:hypothetical protein
VCGRLGQGRECGGTGFGTPMVSCTQCSEQRLYPQSDTLGNRRKHLLLSYCLQEDAMILWLETDAACIGHRTL